MSLTKMGGQVALTVTPEDLHHFANALLAQSRKECGGNVRSQGSAKGWDSDELLF